MTLSLAREQFLDRNWTVTDLDAVAEFWMRLYESVSKAHRFAPVPEHQTEVRLRGFPRADADRLAGSFHARAAATDFGAPTVSHPDPDTLSLRTRSFDGRDAPPVGLGLPVLAAEEFDGLAIEIRFTARDPGGRGTSTLVLAGEVRGDSFLLKSVWRVGLSWWDDESTQFTPWAAESMFLTALEEFRSEGTVPEKMAKKLFPPRGVDRVAALVISLILVPLGKSRLAGLLARAFALVGLVAACGAGCYWLWETEYRFLLAPVALLSIILLFLLHLFIRTERRVWSIGLTQFRAHYAQLDADGSKLAPLNQAESVLNAADPYVRKFTADLAAAGFTRIGDANVVPTSVGEVVLRVFAAPDGVTYLSVVFQRSNPFTSEIGKVLRFWPWSVSFICYTFLTGGGYAASANGPRYGFRRKRSGPECLIRVWPDQTDPVAFAQLHAEAVAKFVAETGRPPLNHVRFEEYIRLQNALVEEERRQYADDPYTLGDHLHWYLQIPRREYRG